jgi:hypothetical protein
VDRCTGCMPVRTGAGGSHGYFSHAQACLQQREPILTLHPINPYTDTPNGLWLRQLEWRHHRRRRRNHHHRVVVRPVHPGRLRR